MSVEVDILENEMTIQYPGILELLLKDHSTRKNIIWATESYLDLGPEYGFSESITLSAITGDNGRVIMPRVKKNRAIQMERVREMAEVYTPSWICNSQNNLIDSAWFGTDGVFNTEFHPGTWVSTIEKIQFPSNLSWQDYVKDVRIEFACGEAPYLTSRYDTTTGDFISLQNRIGILDRKLRIVNENALDEKQWFRYACIAYQSTYGYEWQGDSLLLAREALMYAFLDNYHHMFGASPNIKQLSKIADIVSWNIWQMDGLKYVVPASCRDTPSPQGSLELFGSNSMITHSCEGCSHNNALKHNGAYCLVKDWSAQRSSNSSKKDSIVRFVDIIMQDKQ
jgi:hypothetical protein